MAVSVLAGIPAFDPVAVVTPFTTRDNQSYLSILEALRDHMVLTIDAVNTNGAEMDANYTTLLTGINNAITVANQAVADAAASAASADAASQLINAPAKTQLDTLLGGDVTGLAPTVRHATYHILNALDYAGVDPTGATDSTAGLTQLAADLTAARVLDTAGNYRSGARARIPAGTYLLSSLAATLQFCGDVDAAGARFVVPDAYALPVLTLGGEDGAYLVDADMSLPDVVKSSGAAIVAGSEGYRLQNIGASRIRCGKVTRFERGIRLTGINQGTVYNQIMPGWVVGCKVGISLKPHVASGWANSNTFIGGSVQCSVGTAGGSRLAGWYQCELDGSAGNNVNANTFIGTSFEGDGPQYALYTKNAADNLFTGTRNELGTAGAVTTINGDTLATNAHGLAVGDMVAFTATTYPAELIAATPYFVTTVIDANTYKVATSKGGAAITFSSAGSGVLLYRPPAVYHDMSGTVNGRNVIRDSYAPMGFYDVRQSSTAAAGNTAKGLTEIREKYDPADLPVWGGRNSTGTKRAVFAAYAPGTRPQDDPQNWTTGLGDRGVVFQSGRAEQGVLSQSGGGLSWQRPADTRSYGIPSATRSGSYTTFAGTSAAAGATTAVTVNLPGVAAGDFVVATPQANLPSGLVIAYARVSAADTVTIGFWNPTGAAIDLTNVGIECCVFRRFF